jgi:tetratricopeptide (TPR) repeat protein/transglutaminase-like putative cysteine protease
MYNANLGSSTVLQRQRGNRRVNRFSLYLLLCSALPANLAAQTQSSSSAAAPNAAATAEEAAVFDRLDNLVRYEEDGTGVQETTAVIRVQSQAGVQELGQLVFGYSSATEKLDVDYVRVRKPGGRVVETPASTAQDFAPEVLREAPTYSDYRERHISVAGLQPGDVLEYHTVTRVTTPLAPHEFWYEHSFAKDVAVLQGRLQIDIPKARAVKLKSPARKFETQESGDRRIYTWTIQDFVPDRKQARKLETEEPDYTPDVQLSSFADWQQVAQWYAKLQGDRAVVDESVRKKALELTHDATTPTEKAHRLYDYVARNIRYVSISFGVGRLQPHAASEVLQYGYGDCKDKHTLLQSLLKAEGVQSYPVLISSYRKLDPDVPSPAQFNHEITVAELGGELTWLDTTAEVAPYGLIMYQLRNKQALLAAEGKMGGLRRTPASAPVKNQFAIELDGKFTEAGAFDTTVEITAQGDSDLPLRSVFRGIPQARWSDVLKNLSAIWGLAGDVSDIHVDALEDTSKPFHVAYHYRKDNYFTVPNAGVSFRILPPMQLKVARAANPKKPLEPVNVGPAIEQTYRAHIQFPTNYSVQVPPSATMKRDYGEYSVSYEFNNHVLDAVRRVTLKVDELPPARRNDYESFQNATGTEVKQVLTASITPASAAALASAAKSGGTPEELFKAGNSALQRRDFSAAVDLLKRAMDQNPNPQDPDQKDIWEDLGRAYAGLGQHDDAIRAFRKQLEVDAFHKSANQDLAVELQQQGKFDDAIAAYRKQLEITPFNKSTHKGLGLLLAQLNQDADATKELEAADGIPPDDPEVKVTLARVYARGGNAAKAEALMKSVTGASGAAPGADIYSSALRDDIDANQTLRDARKTLDDLGDQFDSGEFERLGSSAFHAMDLVALAWSRIGWAKYQQGEYLDAMQFLNCSWLLSQSGTVGNRLASVLEKEGQRQQARHVLALAIAAGGGEVAASRERLLKLSTTPEAADREVAEANAEFLRARTVTFPALVSGKSSAQFALVFDGSDKPGRAEWLEGDAGLRVAADKLREKEYPVKFPDASSIKIIRKATVSCDGSGCALVLQALEGLQSSH